MFRVLRSARNIQFSPLLFFIGLLGCGTDKNAQKLGATDGRVYAVKAEIDLPLCES